MRDKQLYKYLTTSIILFVVPIIVLVSFVQINMLEDIEKRYMGQLEENLALNVTSMEQVYMSIDNVKKGILYSDSINAPLNLSDIEESRETLKTLSNYIVTNSYFEDVIVAYRGDQYIYTATGSTYQVLNANSSCLALSYFELDDLNGIMEGPVDGTYNFLPVKDLKKGRSACYTKVIKDDRELLVLFIIDMKQLKENPCFYEVNQENGVIIPSNPYADNVKGQSLLEDKSDDAYVKVEENSGNRTYVEVYSAKDVFGEFRKLVAIFHGIVIALIVLGILSVIVSIKINYLPILQSRIKSIHTATFEFLYRALMGRVTKEEFQKQVKEQNLINLKGNSYFVITFYSDDKGRIKNNSTLNQMLVKYLPGYLVELTESKKYVYFGSLINTDETDYKIATVHIWKSLEVALDSQVSFSCSRIFTDIALLQETFTKTLQALDFRFVKGSSCYIDVSQLIDTELNEILYPKKLIDQFILDVKIGNQAKMDAKLTEICENIKISQMPLFYCKGICYALVIHLITILQELKILKMDTQPSYASILSQEDTVDEIMERIRNIGKNTCLVIQEQNAKNNENEIGEWKDFISENAFREDFSLQMMADHYSINLSNLCNKFKQKTGKTILSLVTEIRMEEAKRLLAEREYVLSEIVEKIGYNNVSSFIRKFKSIYGITPGQYIKINENEKSI